MYGSLLNVRQYKYKVFLGWNGLFVTIAVNYVLSETYVLPVSVLRKELVAYAAIHYSICRYCLVCEDLLWAIVSLLPLAINLNKSWLTQVFLRNTG